MFHSKPRLAQHQTDSFNKLINEHINTSVMSSNPVTMLIDNNHEDDWNMNTVKQYKIVIEFGETTMTKPKHTENNKVYAFITRSCKKQKYNLSNSFVYGHVFKDH